MTISRPAYARVCAAASLLLITFANVETSTAAGALAVGNCGAYGLSYDYKEPDVATAAAIHQCTSRDCQLAASMKSNCAAFAIDGHNACGPYGYATAPQLAQAQNTALRSCYRYGGKDCVIRAFVCDVKN